MIDLHSHILPQIDDGAKSIDISLEMARIAVNDGTKIIACTPHIRPPTYDNNDKIIQSSINALRSRLLEENIDLKLVMGADIHINPNVLERLQNKSAPTLYGTKYFLFEPPHHILPPNIDRFCEQVMQAGYIPVLTHPERLTWIENHYDVMVKMDEMGVAIQLTAGSITGRFGERAKYWSDKFLAEGRVDIIASDAHDPKHRPPKMSGARDYIAKFCDDETARRLTLDNPLLILKNQDLPAKKRTKSIKKTQKSVFRSVIDRLKG